MTLVDFIRDLRSGRRRVRRWTMGLPVGRRRQQLVEAQAAAARWKAEYRRVADERRALELRVRELEVAKKSMLSELRATSRQWKRRVLTTAVLKHLLGARAHGFRVRSETAEPCDRHAAMLTVSTCYRAAIAGGPAALDGKAESMTIAGLTWWVPTDVRQSDRIERAQEQGLPLKAILQTREVAVGAVMLDIGANIGRTAIPRVILGDVQLVYAAEPDPLNYSCLVQNVVGNGLRGFVLPDQVAIGATDGTEQLRRSRFIGGHRILRSGAAPAADVIDVPCWTLDTWVTRLGVSLDAVSFVKIDAQGSECDVLLGARSLLNCRHIAWQLEIDPALLLAAGRDPHELFDLLEGHFTHFIDLNKAARGPRVRRVGELSEALGYLQQAAGKTDVVVYHAGSG